MLALSIDTTSSAGSIALVKDGALLAEFLVNCEINHSETIMPAIAAAFDITKCSMEDIDFFAFSVGPGSFTGLRIGAGIVKGFALATGKPVVGVSSLEALARNIPVSAGDVCPMLDAKRDEVYAALYRPSQDMGLVKISGETVVSPGEFLRAIERNTVFLGDGALRYSAMIRDILPGSIVAPESQCLIRASEVGIMGTEKFRNGEVLDLLTFTPVYLRKSQAEKLSAGAETHLTRPL